MQENDELPEWFKFIKDNPLKGSKIFNVDKAIEINAFDVATNLFRLVKNKGYISVGSFFKNIGKKDLEILLDKLYVIMYVPECNHVELCKNQMIVLAQALLFAEGLTELDTDNIELKLKKLLFFIKITEMHRLGIGKANFGKFSMEGNLDESVFVPN